MLRNIPLLLCFLLQCIVLSAQKVEIEPSISPEFFMASEEITITYDVTGTPMQDWTEAWAWIWVPSSSNANVTSNINPANSNSALSDPAKFTKTESGGVFLFTLKLVPTDFTGLAAADLKDLGMLIKGNDWGDGQSIDYITEVGDEFRLILEKPAGDFAFYETGEVINMHLRSSQTADLEIFIDNTPITSETMVLEIMEDHMVIADGLIHELKFVGTTATSDTDTIIHQYTVPPTPPMVSLPAEVRDGINYEADETKATLVLLAPGKKNVYVLGDFNDWSLDNAYLMNQDGDRFWLALDNLVAGKEYRFQYLVDGQIRIADPYAEKISSPFDDPQIISENRYPGLAAYPSTQTTEGISFLQTASPDYPWENDNYERPAKEELMIYELLVRDFTDERTFQAVIDRLDYLEALGINAIELMPVMEFEGNLSWGYNPAFMFSVDKFYGTEAQLKKLIDEAHKRGMAIILDIVLNHAFGRCPLVRLYNEDTYGPPTDENIWLNPRAKHDFNVGYDFNHESNFTKEYVDRVTSYWIEEYHIDGFRFDLSKGFTQKNTIGNVGAWGAYDASRVALLKRMADEIWTIDPDNYVILEHFADNSEERELADYGMMLWGNMNGAFVSTGRGNTTNIRGLYHGDRSFTDPHLIGYMESHDEERVVFEVLEREDDLTKALDRSKLNAVFFFLVPGPKMIWQFGEVGYDEELNNDRLGIKPPHWEYGDDPERSSLRDVYTSLMNLRSKTDYVEDTYFSWNPEGALKWIHLDHPQVKIAAFGNFWRDTELEETVTFPAAGTWYNYYSGQAINVEDPLNHPMSLSAGEVQVYTSMPIENYIENNPFPEVSNPGPTVYSALQIIENPVQDILSFTYPDGQERIVLYDLAGKRLFEITPEEGENMNSLDVSELPTGVYILSAEVNKEVQSQKFIKK